jgi:hypothetical protein
MQKKSAPPFPCAALAGAALAAWLAPGAGASERMLARFERPAAMARDADLNRVVERGPMGPSASASALGNLVSVQQEGRGNTIMLNIDQSNSGNAEANAVLNGSLSLD